MNDFSAHASVMFQESGLCGSPGIVGRERAFLAKSRECLHSELFYTLGLHDDTSHAVLEDLYGKGGKKTRWDSADADEVAGMEDAFEEHPEDLEDAEEEEREVDPVVDVAPFPEPVSDPRCLVPSALQRKDAVVHMNSSASISSDATTLILGETGTPKTPKPIKDLPGVEPPSGQITPSPPSDPAPRLVYKEVLYVAESPRKLVKAELHDEANEPTRCQPDHMDKLAAMQELAMLEARLKERKMTNAAEAPPPEPEHKDASEDELAPTEPDQEEPTTEQPEQMDKQAAMHELALLQAQLPQSRLFRIESCSANQVHRFGLLASFRKVAASIGSTGCQGQLVYRSARVQAS